MAMENVKEILTDSSDIITVSYEENKKKFVKKQSVLERSFRIYRGGFVGINYCIGPATEEEGFSRAEMNLERQRPYPFEYEPGVRHRDKTEEKLTSAEVIEISEQCMEYLTKKYSDYTFSATFERQDETETVTADNGTDYSNTDGCININVSFKHKSSKDITDGGFGFSLRKYDHSVFTRMADDYLENFMTPAELPDEVIIDDRYYNYAGYLLGQLNGERMALKTSLLTDKAGEKVFNEDFSLYHDVSDKECWFSPFWDGDKTVYPDDRLVLIDNGRIVNCITGKKDAQKYGLLYTGTSYSDYTDIPGTGGVKMMIKRSEKTIKELLNGRYAVIPVMQTGGGFNEKGEYTMPVMSSLLFDGEKVLGKLPAFTISSSFIDIFGKDYIGVGSDKPIYNDKSMLFRVNARKV